MRRAALVAGLVLAVPRLRRLAAEKALPKVRDIRGNLQQIASSPQAVLLVDGSFGRDPLHCGPSTTISGFPS